MSGTSIIAKISMSIQKSPVLHNFRGENSTRLLALASKLRIRSSEIPAKLALMSECILRH